MKNEGKSNSYSKINLCDQIYRESRAMAEYALARGIKIATSVVRTIEFFEKSNGSDIDGSGKKRPVRGNMEIDELIRVHESLARLVEPATPRTILLLDMEQEVSGFWKYFGPVAMIRHMMVAAIISLGLFVLIGLSEDVNSTVGEMKSILDYHGVELLKNLCFYLAAAGLGGSFAALYKANSYITKGTFDPTYQTSYWIRFLLGLISGLVLSIILSEKAFKGVEEGGLLEPGIIRPLLAMLGGFSANLLYTVLSRLVETLESLFAGSTKSIIDAQKQEAKNLVANDKVKVNMRMASNLMKAQQELDGITSPEKVREKLNQLINELVPSDDVEQFSEQKSKES